MARLVQSVINPDVKFGVCGRSSQKLLTCNLLRMMARMSAGATLTNENRELKAESGNLV
jgi:hypothetical protein